MEELNLKQIQQESFRVLLKIQEICNQNNIKFMLAFGTLLGAVRHQGIIPWDDDIDVWMPRPDYERFVQYCIDNEESLRPYVLKHYRTDKKYIYPIARLCDTRYQLDYENARDYGLGLFVDVYPVDGMDMQDGKIVRRLTRRNKWIALCGTNHFMRSRSLLKTCVKLPAYALSRVLNLNKLLKKLDLRAQKYPYDRAEYVGCTVWEPKYFYPKELFDSTVSMPFEGHEMPVPTGYDAILKIEYGDYMKLPPEEERAGHHYYKAYRK